MMNIAAPKEKQKKLSIALSNFCFELEKKLNENYEKNSKEFAELREIRIACRDASKTNKLIEYQLWDRKSNTEFVLAARPICYVRISDQAMLSARDRAKLFEENLSELSLKQIEELAVLNS